MLVKILYEVQVDERVTKDLKAVPEYIIDKFIEILDELEINPFKRRSGVDIKRLVGHPDIYRVRIGNYRVLYSVDKNNHIVKITMFVHRKKAYRKR